MNHFHRWQISVLLIAVFSLVGFAQESAAQQGNDVKVDQRIWSQKYWKQMAEKGLVDLNKQQAVAPAKYTGSKIDALSVSTDDSPDVPVNNTTDNTQSENSIFVNPNDFNNVLQSNNSTSNPVAGVFGANWYVSSDGGASWVGSLQGTGGPNSGDPAVAIRLNGDFHNGYIHDSGGNGAAYSNDGGTTWTDVLVYPNPGSLADKNHLWVGQ